MNRFAINGHIVSEPKVLKLSPLLLFVKIEDNSGHRVNCLVHQHGLNFLYQATLNSHVALYGHYNDRKQFVISKYAIISTKVSA